MYPFAYVPIDAPTYEDVKNTYSNDDQAFMQTDAFRSTPIYNFNRQYYSGNEAKLYLSEGDSESYALIAEAKDIGWNMNENILPLYGYASYTPDSWARGTRLITGQFVVNMLGVNYLDGAVRGGILQAGDKRSSRMISDEVESMYNVADSKHEVLPATIETQKNKYWFNGYSYANINLATIPYFSNNAFTLVVAFRVKHFEAQPDIRIINNIQTLDDVHIYSLTEKCDVSGRPVEQVYQFMAGDFNRKQYAFKQL